LVKIAPRIEWCIPVMSKKKILWWSDSSLIYTGFGRNTKEILFYLYKTGKYDLVEYCCEELGLMI